MTLRTLFELIKKEFIHCYRDPVAMILVLYNFSLCILLCGYAMRYDVDHVSTVIYDMDRSIVSRDLIQRFLSTEYFDLESFSVSMEEMQQRLDNGKAKVALVIPPEFSRSLNESRSARLQLLSDGCDVNRAGQAMGFAKSIIGRFNNDILTERLNRQGSFTNEIPGINNHVRRLYNQEMEGVYFVVVWHIVGMGLLVGLILSSTALVREKERGTIDQIMVTPIRLWEFLIAKTAAPAAIGVVATLLIFLVMLWFHVPFVGNPLLFFFFMGIFQMSMSGVGVVIGTVCNNLLQAILLCVGVSFPFFSLMGAFSPVENLSPFLQGLAQIIPTTHLLVIVNGIVLKGSGFSLLWPSGLKIAGIGLFLFSLSYLITVRQWNKS
ncbi:MAG: ABC transporter permease [Syntrophobacteraceae bacterium]